MSRSWNSLAKRFWPQAPGAISLGMNGDRVSAVRAERNVEGRVVTHFASERLAFIPFRGTGPSAEEASAFAHAIERLAAAVPQGYYPMQIAIPDAAAIIQVMEFESLPESERDRTAIARFRLEKEWPDVAALECTTQVLGSEGNHARLLVVGVQRAWLNCLRDACRAAGLVPHTFDVSVSHVFNRYYDVICATEGDGVLISIEPDTWTIIFWDRSHCPSFVKNSWRDAGEDKSAEYEVIANDVERLVRAYVLAETGRVIGKVHLCASEAESARLSACLDARMRVPCARLDGTEGFSVAPGTEIALHDVTSSVLAAAVARS